MLQYAYEFWIPHPTPPNVLQDSNSISIPRHPTPSLTRAANAGLIFILRFSTITELKRVCTDKLHDPSSLFSNQVDHEGVYCMYFRAITSSTISTHSSAEWIVDVPLEAWAFGLMASQRCNGRVQSSLWPGLLSRQLIYHSTPLH
jgi:hypothetical protein